MADYHYSHTRTEHPDAASFERHCHTEYELLFVLHGRGDFIVEGTRYPLRDGTLLLPSAGISLCAPRNRGAV